jgi:transcriptional regulator with XRE-family HTH domain
MAEIIKSKAIKKGNFVLNSAINLYSSLNGRQITDKQIAQELGITPSTLSKYKNGEIELSQISLLAALLEKIPAEQRMLPFQWAEAFQETISTPVTRREIERGVLVFCDQSKLLEECVMHLAEKDSLGLIFTSEPVSYEKILSRKGKTIIRIEGYDPLCLPALPRQVASSFIETINFLWPERELHCYRFLESLFELMAKLDVLNTVQLYQVTYSDAALRKFLSSNAAAGQFPHEVKAVQESWLDPEPNYKQEDQKNLMRILDPLTRLQYAKLDWDPIFSESKFVIFELGDHNLFSALALKTHFESVVRDKTRIRSFQLEFSKKILLVCDDYSEIATPMDVGFFSASKSLKLFPLLAVRNSEKLDKKYYGSENVRNLLPNFGSLIMYRGCAPSEVVKYVEQHSERRVDFRGVSDTSAYLFHRGLNSSATLEKREFYPADGKGGDR